MERAKKNVFDIEGSSGLDKMEGLNKVQEKRDKFEEMSRKKGQQCFHCEGNHFQSNCSFKNVKCHNCGKIGHTVQKCQKSRERDNRKTFQNSNHVLEKVMKILMICFIFIKIRMENRNHCQLK